VRPWFSQIPAVTRDQNGNGVVAECVDAIIASRTQERLTPVDLVRKMPWLYDFCMAAIEKSA